MTPIQILERVYGYSSFRGNQEKIIAALTAGENAFVLMPTGGGKSVCYQIPSLLRPGVGVVVSPLIALMHDQVRSLQENGVRAEFLNSSLTPERAREVQQALYANELDLLYVSPERLLSEGFLDSLQGVKLALFAIDEAHCVSQWGHDFRPEYQGLSLLAQRFPEVPRIALTATADEPTRHEILRTLTIQPEQTFIHGFDRPNIRYEITTKNQVKQQLLSFINSRHPGDAGIVYCLSRKKVEETAHFLKENGLRAFPYHAGMPQQKREKYQKRFILEEGVIIVATIAFGMGIDKPNVRFVAHCDLPKSIEAYYQETGRAGRDGLPSSAWMAYGLGDLALMQQMITNSDSPQERQWIEQRKLSALLAYAETIECRRSVLLRYFGEEHGGNCGNCDNCLQPPQTWDATVASQKALSCVFRTGQRFGAVHLIDVLLGKASERIENLSHHRLPTFGIGKEHSAREWKAIFRQLIIGGYLTVDLEHFNGFRLTEAAREVLTGRKKLEFRLDLHPKKRTKRSAQAPKAPSPETFTKEDEELFQVLRQKRLQLAKERGIAPYMIFHDSTLRELVNQRPTGREEMRTISGVGEVKLDRYGDEFLRAIQEYLANQTPSSPQPSAAA